MYKIDPQRTFTSQESGRTITYQEMLDSLEQDAFPKTDDDLKDLLWCFGIDSDMVFEELESEEA